MMKAGIVLWIKPNSFTIFLSMFISFLYMSGMQGTVHTRQSSTQSDKYQVSLRYSYLSWWWAHSRPKHVEKRNKHTKKNCAPSWFHLEDYTGLHGQQNIKLNRDSLRKFCFLT
jgi:hypothetical protein